MSGPAMDEAAFLGAVDAIVDAAPGLSPLHAGLVAALGAGIASDSRSFARIFGLAHALVLRAVTEIAGDDGFVAVAGRDARTQRTRMTLTELGRAAFARALATPAV
jgi:hypothetical protein